MQEKDDDYYNSDIHNLLSPNVNFELERTKQKPNQANLDLEKLQEIDRQR